MIYLKLFFTFLKIGAFSFGGGMGMISLLRDSVLAQGWMSEEELMNFIAVSESTPGPIAVNMATFVGSSQGGFLGGLAATAGVVLPSFVIILIIASLFRNFSKNKAVEGVLMGVRPAVVGMILATAVTMGISTLFTYEDMNSPYAISWQGILILLILIVVSWAYRKAFSRKISPIILIMISAICGVLI